jgi:uncharacterized protein YcaQ
MAATNLPAPDLTITQSTARRFMLAHHQLWPPRQLEGKSGALEYIQHVGSIQFDPINIVGRNPDLVLQSRVRNFKPKHLDQLLYEDRHLVDGWDKMACLYAVADWPYFHRRREFLRQNHDPRRPPTAIQEEVLGELRQRGPLSSLDFKGHEKVDWYWGPTKAGRAALEYLYAHGRVGVHHRVNNRRYFDLIDRLLSAELLATPDPFANAQAYEDWHVLRRIGSLGLAHPSSGEYWLGILGVKSAQRQVALKRLTRQGKIIPLEIAEIPGQTYFIRSADLPTLESIQEQPAPDSAAALIAPLDNLLWNRGLISAIFGFDYIWEVYKPAAQRQYGYYVLPILYGEQFVARLDPAFDKKKRILIVQNWWWESDIPPDPMLSSSLQEALQAFGTYLDADQLVLAEHLQAEPTLKWMQALC